jgi:hypothetical protein
LGVAMWTKISVCKGTRSCVSILTNDRTTTTTTSAVMYLVIR